MQTYYQHNAIAAINKYLQENRVKLEDPMHNRLFFPTDRGAKIQIVRGSKEEFIEAVINYFVSLPSIHTRRWLDVNFSVKAPSEIRDKALYDIDVAICIIRHLLFTLKPGTKLVFDRTFVITESNQVEEYQVTNTIQRLSVDYNDDDFE